MGAEYLIFFILFIFGLFIGSFLNVLIDRLPRGESILGRSHCEFCKAELKWFDLIPLISFILLKGKCRFCKAELSFQYPLMEIFTGIMFLVTYISIFNFQFSIFNEIINLKSFIIILVFSLSIVSSLIVIFFVDLKNGIIPDEILIVLVVTISLWLFIFNQTLILNHLIAATAAFLFFLSIFLLTKGRGMGFGDVKFSFLIGLLLGIQGTLLALYIAFLTGAFVGIILILWKKKGMKSAVAFGPFLVIGTVLSLFYSPILLPIILALLS